MEMIVQNDALIIKSIEKKPRKDWDKAFARMSKLKEDKLFLPDNIDSENFNWTW
ncbi:MAG: hypothetical protein FWD78_02620 [Treponema sp.]|nr:hypothetical protein [Treponema sp.]